MTLRGSAVLAGLIALPSFAMALPPCVGADLATPLPKATEVAQTTMDIPAARFPGIWQQGQLNGFAYRIFPDLTAVVFDERANTGWRIDLLCTASARCVQTVVGAAPETASAAAKAIGECLVPVEESPGPPSPAPPAAPPHDGKADAVPTVIKPAAKPAPVAKATVPKPAEKSVTGAAAGKPAKPVVAAKASPPSPAGKKAAPSAPALPATPLPKAKMATPATSATLPKLVTNPDRLTPAKPDAPRKSAQGLAAIPSSAPTETAALGASRPSIGTVAANVTSKSTRLCPAASAQDRGSAMRAIQRLLVSLGSDPGPIDGVKGKRTVAALDAIVGPDITQLDPVSVLIVLTGVICADTQKAK